MEQPTGDPGGPIVNGDLELEKILRELTSSLGAQAPCAKRLIGFAMQSTTVDDLAWLLHIARRMLEADYLLAECELLDRARTRIAYLGSRAE